MSSNVESIVVRLLEDIDTNFGSSREALDLLKENTLLDDEVFLLEAGLLVRRIIHGNKSEAIRVIEHSNIVQQTSNMSFVYGCLLKYENGKTDYDELLTLQRNLRNQSGFTPIERRLTVIAYVLALLSLQLPIVCVNYLRRNEVDSSCCVIRLLSCEVYFQLSEYSVLSEELKTLQPGVGADWQARIAELALIRSGNLEDAVAMVSSKSDTGLPLNDDVLIEYCIISYRQHYFNPRFEALVESSPYVSKHALQLYKAVCQFTQGNVKDGLNILREVLAKIDDYLVQTMYFENSAKVNGATVLAREIADYKELYGEDVFWFAVVCAIESAPGTLVNPFLEDPSLPYDQTEFFTYYSIISQALG